MKKIIAFILAAFFVVLSPLSAFASATESMIMYVAVDDEYGVMPLAVGSPISFSYGVGIYNMSTDSYDISYVNPSFSGNNFSSTPLISKQVTYLPSYKFAIGFTLKGDSSSNLGSLGGSLRLVVDEFGFVARPTSSEFYYNLNSNDYSLFNSYALIKYRAMGVPTNSYTHISVYGSAVVPLTSLFSTGSNWYNHVLDVTIPFVEPSYWSILENENSNTSFERIYNTYVTEISIFSAYDLSLFTSSADSSSLIPLVSGNPYYFVGQFRNSSPTIYTIVDSSSSSDTITGGLTSVSNQISSSMSNLSKNMSSQITQVKTQITQSTNTISTKIDTMSSNIQQGLQNVVQSAQQNTQNIINTVNQKVDQVKAGITQVKDSIIDLPNKIEEMLLGLIVPDSDTMASKYSEFSGLLEEKLGVIYQIPMMLFDFFDTIVNAATTPQSTLTLPAFQLPWIDGSTLTVWQAMEYKIIPDGLQVLSDLIKTITSMTVVVLTFNSVKRAYERFLRS